MIVEAVDVALRAVRVAPVRALQERPPFAPETQVDGMRRRREDERARVEHVRQRARIVRRIGDGLREGDVSGRFDEFLELPVGDRRAIDPEAVDRDAMDRRFFRIVPVRAHAERAAGNEQHVPNDASGRAVRTRLLRDRFMKSGLHHVRPPGVRSELEDVGGAASCVSPRGRDAGRRGSISGSRGETRARGYRRRPITEPGPPTHARHVDVRALAVVPGTELSGTRVCASVMHLRMAARASRCPGPRLAARSSRRKVRPAPRGRICSEFPWFVSLEWHPPGGAADFAN